MILSFKKVGHQVFNSQAFFADFSILQIQVPQELQNEEEPSQSKMDQGL
jgi:hypothetical protein